MAQTRCQFEHLINLWQSLTRVSISRKSREEITHIFLSWPGELYFHFYFSSRFSRFWDKNSLYPLDLWVFYSNSLSLLNFQDCEEKILFLFLWRNASYFREKYAFFRVWGGGKLLCKEVLGDIWCQKRTIVNQNLNPFFKSKMSGKISLLENYELSISLSLLKIGEQHLKFVFSKMEKLFSLSLSLLEAWE